MFNTYLMALNIILLLCIILAATVIIFSKDRYTTIIALFIVGILLAFEFLFFRAIILAIIQAVIGGLIIPILFFKAEKKVDLKEDK